MARGSAFIYLRWSGGSERWYLPLERAGLTVEHKRTGRVTSLSAEPGREGAQVELTRAELRAQWSEVVVGGQLTFQFWLDADSDVVCSLARPSKSLLRIELDFDGLSVDQVDAVVDAAGSVVRSPTAHARAFVVDRVGREIDWDHEMTRRPRWLASQRLRRLRHDVVYFRRDLPTMSLRRTPGVVGG